MMRTSRWVSWVFCAAAAAFIAGCAGHQILDLNGQLIQAQQQKANIEQARDAAQGVKRDEAVIKIAQLAEQFEGIANTAYAQAAQSPDPKAKISLYRIAATADWQRGNERALTVAQEGTQACNTLNGFNIAPRDCAILLMIPNLLVNDLWVAKLNKPGGINPSAPDFVSRGREAVAGLVQAYNGLNNVLSSTSGRGVSDELVQMLQGQGQRIQKSIQDLGNLIVARASPGDRPAAMEVCAFIRSEAPAALPSRCR
jgi:hypothetical protein